MAEISIIIPVYNSERYLRTCVESVLSQSFQDFELILVDDGSKDNSLAICKEYAENDFRVKVVAKKNGGAGSARNAGMDVVSCEDIIFVDSDDTIKSNFLERIMQVRESADFVIFGVCHCLKDKQIGRAPAKEFKVYSKSDFFASKEYYTYPSMLTGPVSRVFKKHIIDANHLRFEEDMSFGEDSLFDVRYADLCNSVALDCDYYYYINKTNESSITQNYLPNYLYCINKYVLAADLVFAQNMSSSNYKRFIKESLYNYITSITYIFQNSKLSSERIDVIKEVENCSFIRRNWSSKLSFKQKMIILFLKMRLTHIVYFIFKKNTLQ